MGKIHGTSFVNRAVFDANFAPILNNQDVVNDYSSESNDGVVSNVPYESTSTVDGGYYIFREGSEIDVADDDSLDLTDELTIVARVNLTDSIGDQTIVHKGDANVGTTNFDFRIANGQIRLFWVNTFSRGFQTSSSHVNVGEPVHVAVRHKSGDVSQSRIYVDGVSVALSNISSPDLPLFSNTQTMTIGGKN